LYIFKISETIFELCVPTQILFCSMILQA